MFMCSARSSAARSAAAAAAAACDEGDVRVGLDASETGGADDDEDEPGELGGVEEGEAGLDAGEPGGLQLPCGRNCTGGKRGALCSGMTRCGSSWPACFWRLGMGVLPELGFLRLALPATRGAPGDGGHGMNAELELLEVPDIHCWLACGFLRLAIVAALAAAAVTVCPISRLNLAAASCSVRLVAALKLRPRCFCLRWRRGGLPALPLRVERRPAVTLPALPLLAIVELRPASGLPVDMGGAVVVDAAGKKPWAIRLLLLSDSVTWVAAEPDAMVLLYTT